MVTFWTSSELPHSLCFSHTHTYLHQVRLFAGVNKSNFNQSHWVCLEMRKCYCSCTQTEEHKEMSPSYRRERPRKFCQHAEFPLLVLFARSAKRLFSDTHHLRQRWRGTVFVGQACIVLGLFHTSWSPSEGSLPASNHDTELPRSRKLETVT